MATTLRRREAARLAVLWLRRLILRTKNDKEGLTIPNKKKLGQKRGGDPSWGSHLDGCQPCTSSTILCAFPGRLVPEHRLCYGHCNSTRKVVQRKLTLIST